MVGTRFDGRPISDSEAVDTVARALESSKLDGKRVIMIVPDHTRTAPMPLMFRSIYEQLTDRVVALDVLVALGTHPPMSMDHIYRHVGITAEEHETRYGKTMFFNHLWKDPDALTVAGTIPRDRIQEITEGKFDIPVDVQVNKMILDYDHIMIVGPVFPHEVAGYSGGNKYIFPGIAGQGIIDFFHWLGALITNPKIIGTKYTPVRAVIDAAVSYIPTERSAFSMVLQGHDLMGLYYGGAEESWSAAADQSDELNIIYKDRPYHTVLSRAPEMYDDIWTAGKCMYKLEPVVADGGTLIIYAPHVTEISYTHGNILDQIGYHTRDFFTCQWEKYQDYPWGVVAHSTHVRGIGCYENGVEKPRVNVVLATSIPEDRCKQVNLGYMNPAEIRVEDYQNREDEGILYVPRAGEMLYRLKQRS